MIRMYNGFKTISFCGEITIVFLGSLQEIVLFSMLVATHPYPGTWSNLTGADFFELRWEPLTNLELWTPNSCYTLISHHKPRSAIPCAPTKNFRNPHQIALLVNCGFQGVCSKQGVVLFHNLRLLDFFCCKATLECSEGVCFICSSSCLGFKCFFLAQSPKVQQFGV